MFHTRGKGTRLKYHPQTFSPKRLSDACLYALVAHHFRDGFTGVERHFALREVWGIKGIEAALVILLRILLRQHKGLGETALLIY